VDLAGTKVVRAEIRERRAREVEAEAKAVRVALGDSVLGRAVDAASEKGASAVFSTRPLEQYGFCFKAKRDFRDLIALRYGRSVRGLPGNCACGAVNSVKHSQICKKGGFIHHRHNEFEGVWAAECRKVFPDVECEPLLEELSGEEMVGRSANVEDGARSDVRVRGFWGNMKNAFFDFRVFYPFASSYSSRSLASVYRSCSAEKKRAYAARVEQVEDGSFTPMVMSSVGGMGPEMGVALKFLAAKIAAKEGCDYSSAVNVLRCKMSFVAARTTLVCLRGSRALYANRVSRREVWERDAPVALVAAQM
jgi:hypothetical protein